jgi:phosphoribosylformylglycinamidine cyclo-ligase
MYRTFNCGVGMVIALPEEAVEPAIALLTAAGEKAWKIGKLTASSDEQQVVING